VLNSKGLSVIRLTNDEIIDREYIIEKLTKYESFQAVYQADPLFPVSPYPLVKSVVSRA
jgi:hypothetical protein